MLPTATVLSYVQPIASALDYAHAHRLIHRDLKPENLLFGRDNDIVLSDFGMALLLRSTDSMSMQGIGGTVAYMAPEQIRGKPSAASDQYALSIMVYEWLAGSRPFHGGAAELCGQHLFVSPPPLTSLVPDLSPLLERVLFKALAKDPGARFASVGAFANALEDASRGKAPAPLFEAAPVDHTSGANRTQTRNSYRKRMLHLPTQLISLVGREAERKAACVLLVRPEVRLLTMTGPGGIGKTSLALSVADDMQDNFADGVCFVPLAAVHDPELVVPAIAEALEQQMGQRPILEIVRAYLRDRHLLLVLDNFEQVVQAASSLSELLQSCPDLTIVVTSRESLRVQGEHEFPVPALDLPDLTKYGEKAMLGQHAAIALFVERAQAINQAFRLTEENARAVAEICVRLDGLPLALELAAVQIKLWSPAQVLSRLSSRLQVLTGGRRDAPARQRTLRDAIKWSYDLLSASQQQLFRRLSIFVGGCSLEAIEELYRLLGDDPALVADEVAALLDKNVIKSGGHSREGI